MPTCRRFLTNASTHRKRTKKRFAKPIVNVDDRPNDPGEKIHKRHKSEIGDCIITADDGQIALVLIQN